MLVCTSSLLFFNPQTFRVTEAGGEASLKHNSSDGGGGLFLNDALTEKFGQKKWDHFEEGGWFSFS